MFHGQSLNPWHAGAFFLWIVVIHFCGTGDASASCLSQRHYRELIEGIAGMLTIIKASLLGSALMLWRVVLAT